MNKLTSAVFFSFTALFFLSSCGSGGSSSSSVSERTISGTLTGDLSNISGVRAVSGSDGTVYSATTTSSARTTALTGASAGFQVTVPVDDSYTLDLVGADDTPVASLQFNTSATGASTTGKIPLTGGASTSIDLGIINIPTGTGATTGGIATVTPSVNPLTEVDSDSDGMNDFEDDDDDNDGISDDNESHDGKDDSKDSPDSSSDSSNGSDSSHDGNDSKDSSNDNHDSNDSNDSSDNHSNDS
ncbi:hypothetical protein MNBD_NITROSPINAE03-1089 [hydrothermal vent metagenome]|uniref:Uncharacterized protein n=1 Tax=hydrothermal vent metagenome TaxID=652676 RepID=A0A3B1C3T9_9ZZZZ